MYSKYIFLYETRHSILIICSNMEYIFDMFVQLYRRLAIYLLYYDMYKSFYVKKVSVYLCQKIITQR